MCIIIQRDAKFIMPRDKFDASVINNPDGWGLTVPSKEGLLTTIRSVDGETDGDYLYDLLHSEFADDKLLLHLRYTTAGDTSLRNAHPFPVLEFEADGIDLRMAHNGTIHKFKPTNSWESDTRCFVRTLVRPLFKRLVAGVGVEGLLKDKFVQNLLSDLIPTSSVLSFIDGFGNTLNVNEKGNGGSKEEGWYYSNKYSFDAGHRKPTDITRYRGNSNYSSMYGAGYHKPESNVVTRHAPAMADSNTELFSEKYSIGSPEDMSLLSDDVLGDLSTELPEDLLLLTKELLAINHQQRQEISNLKKANASMSSRLQDQKQGEEHVKAT